MSASQPVPPAPPAPINPPIVVSSRSSLFSDLDRRHPNFNLLTNYRPGRLTMVIYLPMSSETLEEFVAYVSDCRLQISVQRPEFAEEFAVITQEFVVRLNGAQDRSLCHVGPEAYEIIKTVRLFHEIVLVWQTFEIERVLGDGPGGSRMTGTERRFHLDRAEFKVPFHTTMGCILLESMIKAFEFGRSFATGVKYYDQLDPRETRE